MSEITTKITGSHTAKMTTRTVLDRVRAAVPELMVESVRASHHREAPSAKPRPGQKQTIFQNCNGEGRYSDLTLGGRDFYCSRCKGTGRVEG